ncbi:MAG: hypothetical protein EXS42_04660 [Lacunisphaera sp.]|nr:hypothetical protein [Lacunisphaera sp.]
MFPNAFAQRQLGKKKGPTSKLYVAETRGETQIQTGGKIYAARQATAFDAPGTVIETKDDSHNAFVYSNGIGMFIDQNTRVAVTDSLLIAERTDEVIYVCRFNRAYRKHIRLYIRQIRESKNELLGIVLNGLSARRIEYYSNYCYYRSYKKYYGSQS